MHRLVRSTSAAIGLLVSAAFFSSCADGGTTKPSTAPAAVVAIGAPRVMSATLPPVRISEIHYDNTGTDVGEAIEISAPISADLTGWSIVLYNGSGGATYDTDAIGGLASTACPGGTRKVVVLTYPSNGIQNGSPDGIALIDNAGAVVEFLSYEGPFAATNGPANGRTATDIGVSEVGEPLVVVGGVSLVQSLKRNGSDVWSAPGGVPHSFGVCNDDIEPPPPATVDTITVEPATATVVVGGTQAFVAKAFDASNNEIPGAAITWSSSDEAIATVNNTGVALGKAVGDAEIRATAGGITGKGDLTVEEPEPDAPTGPLNIVEIHYDDAGADAQERIEVRGPARMNLAGWSLVLYNGSNNAPYGTINLSGVLEDQCAGFGVSFVEAPGLQNGSPDGIALVNPGGVAVEFLSYEGPLTGASGPAAGIVSTNLPRQENGEADGRSLQKDDLGWYGPALASFGQCNSAPAPSVNVFGRAFDDPPLPVGFEFQLFAEYDNGRGEETPTTFTWVSDNADLLGVDQDGVVRAKAIGSGVIRAIAADGSVGTFTVGTQAATPSDIPQYGNHTEFGDPTDADASDDHIIRYEQYTTSYNRNRNTPNWVSFNLEASHIGANRCNCFTFDQSLPPEFLRYTTADFVGTLDFYGFQYDRGHLLRSFDRAGVLDNARTFYFTNIIPQAADNNQGPWAVLETHLASLAQNDNRELYVIAGVAGSLGTLMNRGEITIPEHVWKVAIIMPRDQGLANIDSYDDVQVLAVIMPNRPNRPNDPLKTWQEYQTTVDAIEALTGYDLLKLLPDQVEIAVESGTRPPTAALNGPFTSNEGASVPMSASASSDPDLGDVLSYRWNFGDASAEATGVNAMHTYAQNGTYTVTLTVADRLGLTATATTTATVVNVPPTITSFNGAASVVSGAPYSVSGTFADPGVNDAPWGASFTWGEGAPTFSNLFSQAIVASASHTYFLAGTYLVRFTITDRDGGSDFRELTVSVARLAVGAELDHEKFKMKGNGNHRISFHVLSSVEFDARSLVPSSARIGSVGVAVKQNHDELETEIRDVNGDGRPDLVLDFYRRELIDAGELTDATRTLTLTADLTDGRQIVTRAVVRPK